MIDKKEAIKDMVDYMLSHEDDIAHGVNDFGDLKDAFEFFVGRPASKAGKII